MSWGRYPTFNSRSIVQALAILVIDRSETLLHHEMFNLNKSQLQRTQLSPCLRFRSSVFSISLTYSALYPPLSSMWLVCHISSLVTVLFHSWVNEYACSTNFEIPKDKTTYSCNLGHFLNLRMPRSVTLLTILSKALTKSKKDQRRKPMLEKESKSRKKIENGTQCLFS